MNHSPRLDQLTPRPFFPTVQQDFSTDVVIVGGGIAGISTLYYILKNTDRKVTLLESYKIAHGSTGHNAGQIVPYFEKPFVDIVETYGITMANQGQQALLDARERVQELVTTMDMDNVFEKFIGYAGCSTIEHIIETLQKNTIQGLQHIQYESVLVSEDFDGRDKIPSIYEDMIQIVSQRRINQLLQTKGNTFIGALARRAGTLNSALFCEKALQHIIKQYHDRVQVYEFSPVDIIDLYDQKVKITTQTSKVHHLHDTPPHNYTGTITAKQVILCTNGFENFTINNHAGPEINKSFHEEVSGIVAYMSGYLDIAGQSPLAISYYMRPGELKSADDVENYFYLTRRQFHKDNQIHSLICIGGPEVVLHEKDRYMRHESQPDRTHQQIDAFLQNTFSPYPKQPTKYHYRRHGLLGSTKSGLRIIGPDKRNTKLLYNIGCNGVGILSSVHGGRKISQFLLGNITQASIFDPQ